MPLPPYGLDKAAAIAAAAAAADAQASEAEPIERGAPQLDPPWPYPFRGDFPLATFGVTANPRGVPVDSAPAING